MGGARGGEETCARVKCRVRLPSGRHPTVAPITTARMRQQQQRQPAANGGWHGLVAVAAAGAQHRWQVRSHEDEVAGGERATNKKRICA